jgi:hypothetical protein
MIFSRGVLAKGVLRANKAVWILSLVTTPDRAKVLAAELAAATGSRAPMVFWLSLTRVELSLVLKEVRASPLRLAALVVAGIAVTYLLGEAFVVGPYWLIHRPYGSLLPSFWIRRAAYVILRGDRICRYIAGPFLVGIFVAWLSHGREIAACLAILVWDLVVVAAERVWGGHLGLSRIWVALLYTLWWYLPVLAGAIVARMWFLRNLRRSR